MLQRFRMLTVASLLMFAAATTGCAALDNAIDGVASQYDKPLVWMNATHKGNGSDVLVGYRLPPPPDGKVYVVWGLTRDHSKTQKLAVITDGAANGSITGTTNFRIEGAMISVEDSPNVTKIGEDRGITDVGMR